MLQLLLLLFIAVPVFEIWLLIQVGGELGVLNTVFLVILTAVVGAWLVRAEGMKTVNAIQARLNAGQMPGAEMVEGAMLLFAGALLLTPGFFTDTVGFLLVFPLTRPLIRHFLVEAFRKRAAFVHMSASSDQGGFHHRGSADHPRGEDIIVEGEVIRNPEDAGPPRSPGSPPMGPPLP